MEITIQEYHELRNNNYQKKVDRGIIKDTDYNFEKFDVEYFIKLNNKGYIIKF